MKVFNLGEMLSSSATSVFKSLHIGSTVRVTTDHYDPANGIVGSIQRNSKGNINMIICTNIDTSESNIMGIKPIKLNNGDFTISSAIKRVHDNVIDNNRLFITHIRQFDLLTLNSDHTYKILDVSPLANDTCIVNHKRIDNLVDFMLKSDYQLNQARSYTEIERDNDKIASGDVFRHKDKDLILLNIGSDVNASVRFLKESYVFDTDEIVNTITIDSDGYIIRSDAIDFSTFRNMIVKGTIERYRRLTPDAYLHTVRLLSIEYQYRFRESDFINI